MTVPRHILALTVLANSEYTDDAVPPQVAAIDAAAELATVATHIIYPAGSIHADLRNPARLCRPFARLWHLAGRPEFHFIRTGDPRQSATRVVMDLADSAFRAAWSPFSELCADLADSCLEEAFLAIGYLAIVADGPEPRHEQRIPDPSVRIPQWWSRSAFIDAATALFCAAAFPANQEPTP